MKTRRVYISKVGYYRLTYDDEEHETSPPPGSPTSRPSPSDTSPDISLRSPGTTANSSPEVGSSAAPAPSSLHDVFASFSEDGDHSEVEADTRPRCGICQKVFSRKSAIDRHHKQVHLREKRRQCHVCGKCFTRLDKLKEHINMHLGIKLYECPVCNKSFGTSGTLYNHRKTHGPYQCKQCTYFSYCHPDLLKHVHETHETE